MIAFDGHYWRDADGRPWSLDSVTDECQVRTRWGGICGQTPDAHPFEKGTRIDLLLVYVSLLASVLIVVVAVALIFWMVNH